MKNLQELVAKSVAERGYREGWTDEQFAARQVCKAVEELEELAASIQWTDAAQLSWLPDWVGYLSEAGHEARAAFDGPPERWQEVGGFDLEAVTSELADAAIPLLALADTLGIDLEQAIRDKVTGDVARGVRGDKPEAWASERPAGPGWYWRCAPDSDDAWEAVLVKRARDGALIFQKIGQNWDFGVERFGGKWVPANGPTAI
jgi:NTP pyrophosphatase (non-canonical NTP hydrolase)